MARFMRKGTTKAYFVPTIASASAPTVAEVTAGTHLSPQISEINGFKFANSPISTPDLNTDTVSKISGENTLEDSSMVFYEQKGTDSIKTALAKGTAGYVVIFPSGIAGATPAAADKAEVWAVEIASNSRNYTVGNEAATYTVDFVTTAAPVSAVIAA